MSTMAGLSSTSLEEDLSRDCRYAFCIQEEYVINDHPSWRGEQGHIKRNVKPGEVILDDC